MEETSPMELKRNDDRRHKFWRFDPTVSTGTLLTLGMLLVTVAGGYATYREDRVTMLTKISTLEADVARDRENQKVLFESFRGDVKDIKIKMDGISENVTILKAQGAVLQQGKSR